MAQGAKALFLNSCNLHFHTLTLNASYSEILQFSTFLEDVQEGTLLA